MSRAEPQRAALRRKGRNRAVSDMSTSSQPLPEWLDSSDELLAPAYDAGGARLPPPAGSANTLVEAIVNDAIAVSRQLIARGAAKEVVSGLGMIEPCAGAGNVRAFRLNTTWPPSLVRMKLAGQTATSRDKSAKQRAKQALAHWPAPFYERLLNQLEPHFGKPSLLLLRADDCFSTNWYVTSTWPDRVKFAGDALLFQRVGFEFCKYTAALCSLYDPSMSLHQSVALAVRISTLSLLSNSEHLANLQSRSGAGEPLDLARAQRTFEFDYNLLRRLQGPIGMLHMTTARGNALVAQQSAPYFRTGEVACDIRALFGGGTFWWRVKPGWMVWSVYNNNAADIFSLVRSSLDMYYDLINDAR